MMLAAFGGALGAAVVGAIAFAALSGGGDDNADAASGGSEPSPTSQAPATSAPSPTVVPPTVVPSATSAATPIRTATATATPPSIPNSANAKRPGESWVVDGVALRLDQVKFTPNGRASCSTQDRSDLQFELNVLNESSQAVVFSLAPESTRVTLNTGKQLVGASRFGLNVCGSYPAGYSVAAGKSEYLGQFYFAGDLTDNAITEATVVVTVGRFQNATWRVPIAH